MEEQIPRGKVSPDTEENVIGETEEIFKNFLHESYKRDSDREAGSEADLLAATPSAPLLQNFTPDPLSRAAQVGRRLAKIGDDVNKQYQHEFDNMINKLNVDRYTAYAVFKQVAVRLTSGPLNWGRIVALFSFGYRILVRVIGLGEVIKDFARVVKDVVGNIVTFFKDSAQGVARWIANQGGWRAVLNYVVPSISWGAFGAICASAALTLSFVYYLHRR